MTKKSFLKKKKERKKEEKFFEKNSKKKFFRKTGFPAKPKYPENRGISGTFFRVSFLKFNSLQIYVKKLTF